jgi:hypothetical protein
MNNQDLLHVGAGMLTNVPTVFPLTKNYPTLTLTLALIDQEEFQQDTIEAQSSLPLSRSNLRRSIETVPTEVYQYFNAAKIPSGGRYRAVISLRPPRQPRALNSQTLSMQARQDGEVASFAV